MISTRLAFGQTLAKLGEQKPNLVVLDAEMSNSTFTNLFQEKFPDRFVQCFISEQNMISTALGLNLGGFVPVCATFAAFLTRCFDQIRMSQYTFPKTNLKIAGSHCGVSIGTDGPSQMALEDIAMFATVHDSIILYPSDEVSAKELTKIFVEHFGIGYLRLTRDETASSYTTDQNPSSNQNENPDLKPHSFKIGGSYLWKSYKNPLEKLEETEMVGKGEKNLGKNSKITPKITLISAGITLHECLKVREKLENVAVLDLYSIKPVDELAVLRTALASEMLITVEDHYYFGGINSIVNAFLGQFNIPHLKEKVQTYKQNNQQNSQQNNKNKEVNDELFELISLIKANLSQFTIQKIDEEMSQNPDFWQVYFQSFEVCLEFLGIRSLCVKKIPRSGSKEKLLEFCKIDSEAIISLINES